MVAVMWGRPIELSGSFHLFLELLGFNLRRFEADCLRFGNIYDFLFRSLFKSATTYGLSPNIHSGCIYSTVTMDELFAEPATV